MQQSTASPKILRFVLALLMSLMLKDGGFSMIATVCSSWVFVNRSTTLGGQRKVLITWTIQVYSPLKAVALLKVFVNFSTTRGS